MRKKAADDVRSALQQKQLEANSIPVVDVPSERATLLNHKRVAGHQQLREQELGQFIVEFLAEVTDRNWVVTLFLAAWCPVHGKRVAGYCSRPLDMILVTLGVGCALLVRYMLAVLMKQSKEAGGNTWVEPASRIAAAILLWMLAIKAYSDYRDASRRDELQKDESQAATSGSTGRGIWGIILGGLLYPFVVISIVAFSDPLEGMDGLGNKASLLMPVEEIIGAGSAVVFAVLLGNLLEKSVGATRFLLIASFTLALYALVITSFDVLWYGFGVAPPVLG